MAFGYIIQEIERASNIAWVDVTGAVHRGPVAIFEATKGERWLRLIVKSNADYSISTVEVALARLERDEILQIMRKTDLYQLSDKIPSMLYHPIGFAYMDPSGRLRRPRITSDDVDRSELLENILKELAAYRIQIRKYEEATSKESPQYIGKLCVIVRAGDFEAMAVAFVGEKVFPLIG